MLFFRFEHSKAPVALLMPGFAEMGRHRSTGKYVHLKPEGEQYHYVGHTDGRMMDVLRASLQQGNVAFTELDESKLPRDKQKIVAAYRRAGLLG